MFFDARYNILRNDSSFVKLGLFFVICRNCRFNPSMMFVVYIIFRISAGYAKNVDNISQLSSHVFTQDGYDLLHFSLKLIRLWSASSSVTAVYGNVKICAVEKSPKSEIYVISNLFFWVERSETRKNRFARRRLKLRLFGSRLTILCTWPAAIRTDLMCKSWFGCNIRKHIWRQCS